MKVLLLAPYPPFPPQGGGQQRMYQIIRHLGARHSLHLLTYSPHDGATLALGALRPFCRVTTVTAPTRTPFRRLQTTLGSRLPDMLWRGRSPAFAAALRSALQTDSYDIVQAESIEMTQYAPGRSTPAAGGPLWLYDAWNIEYMIQRRAFLTDLRQPRHALRAGYSLLQWIKLRRYEQQLHRRFGGTFVVSSGDRALLQHIDPPLVTAVVPNGVDLAYFCPQPQTDGVPTVLFTGTLDYRPNIDAILWFVEAVWPRVYAHIPAARLAIVGRNPTAELVSLHDQSGITVVPNVTDVRPFFDAATVYVVPMRIGGGVRLKVLEAFAQRVPVVATTLGVDGIAGLHPGVHAAVTDDARGFAHAVMRLFEDKQQVGELTTAARRLVEQHYDWSVILPRMETAWQDWVAGRPAR